MEARRKKKRKKILNSSNADTRHKQSFKQSFKLQTFIYTQLQIYINKAKHYHEHRRPLHTASPRSLALPAQSVWCRSSVSPIFSNALVIANGALHLIFFYPRTSFAWFKKTGLILVLNLCFGDCFEDAIFNWCHPWSRRKEDCPSYVHFCKMNKHLSAGVTTVFSIQYSLFTISLNLEEEHWTRDGF